MKKLGFIKKELRKIYGKDKTTKIIELAEKHYKECMALCENASKGEFMHLENTILPTTSFYKALLEVDNENAWKNTNDIIINLCKKGNKILNNMLKLPGMKSVFMKVLPKMAIKMFGKECGFDYENMEVSKKHLQMDMTICPYTKYAEILKVPELKSIFCESDFATYGNLSGITFERTETIGLGGNKCDFRFFRTDK